jgi:hypothetical protein
VAISPPMMHVVEKLAVPLYSRVKGSIPARRNETKAENAKYSPPL